MRFVFLSLMVFSMGILMGCTVDKGRSNSKTLSHMDQIEHDTKILQDFRKSVIESQGKITYTQLEELYNEANKKMLASETKSQLTMMMLSIMPYFPEEGPVSGK